MNKNKKTQYENGKGDKLILNDPRFAHLVTDPRFKNLPHAERKVKIDKRFQSMFNDDKFKLKYTVDKYGRRVNNKTSGSEDLKKYYEIDSNAEEDEEHEKERRQEEIQIAKDSENSEDDIINNDELGNDGVILPKHIKYKLLKSDVDYARGEGRILSDSSSDDELSSDDDSEIFIEHVWGELDADAETTEKSTKRLAACNMDWDRIRALDILVLCSSFLQPGGSILSVKIYPSEFGKERLQKEELNGPQELVSTKSNSKQNNLNENCSDSDKDDDELSKEENSDIEEGADYHMEKLRQYQLNRLKYYYAVIECDSIKTADKIYSECDGLEYESTATKFDLRFIPEEEIFNDNEIKDICTELPDLNKYKPRIFTTTALQQAKVELTWDETNVERRELSDKLAAGKLNDVSDAELRKYVAYSSEENEEDNENDELNSENEKVKPNGKEYISKYTNLLNEIVNKEKEKKNNRYEMEFTWGINVNSNKLKDETLKEKTKTKLTLIEKALEKKKEKNKRRKDERKKLAKQRNSNFQKNSEDDSINYDDVPDGIDLNDPYFAEEFTNGDFKPVNNLKTNKNNKKNSKSHNDDDGKNIKELELLLDDTINDKNHFSLEKILKIENETKSNKKRKHQLNKSKKIDNKYNQEEDNFKLNTKDKRFTAIYKSHLFNIDPTDSHYKKTRGMEQIIREKLKRKDEMDKRTDKIFENQKSKTQIENKILYNKIRKLIHDKK